MEFDYKTGKYITFDTPTEQDKCKACGGTTFICCKECNCYECSNDVCGDAFIKG